MWLVRISAFVLVFAGLLGCARMCGSERESGDSPGAETRPVDPGPTSPAPGARPVSLRGTSEMCARFTNGALWCWGEQRVKTTGPSTAESVSQALRRPRKLTFLEPVKAFDIGFTTGAAVLETGELVAWNWEMDDVGRPARQRSVKSCTISGAIDVWARHMPGGFTEAVVYRTEEGRLLTWRPDMASTGCDRSTPTPLGGIEEAKDLACSRTRCCAVHGEAGRVSCFNGDKVAEVPDVENVKELTVGSLFALLRLKSGQIETINTAFMDNERFPSRPSGLSAEKLKVIATATRFSPGACFLTPEGRAACTEVIEALDGLGGGIRELAVGLDQACGLYADDQIHCVMIRGTKTRGAKRPDKLSPFGARAPAPSKGS